ncbi:MAG: hypothetical protein J7L39_04380 [Candidatus Aenigmarchaeota archaeon]|nr:hypothetical protein [Candidatus Aenigmarchaeota archaeon]
MLIFSLTFAFFLTRLFYTTPTPEEMIKNYAKKFNETYKLKLVYSVKIPLLGPLSSDLRFEYYKLGRDKKILASLKDTIISATYIKNKKVIDCTESRILSSYVTCSLREEEPSFGIAQPDEKLLNQTKISYEGAKVIAGRECDDFFIVLNYSEASEIEESTLSITGLASLPAKEFESGTSQNESLILVEVCMDKKYGYVALMNISESSYSTILGKSAVRNILSLEVIEMSTEVSEEDLRIPVVFSLDNVTCEENKVTIELTSFQNIKNPTINLTLSSGFFGYENITTAKEVESLEEGENYSFDLYLPQNISGFYSVDVCIDKDCQTDYCYVTLS